MAVPRDHAQRLPAAVIATAIAFKRYVIGARMDWVDYEGPTPWIRGLEAGLDERGTAKDTAMVQPNALNGYQRELLSQHCSLMAPTSLCEGNVYLEILPDPRNLRVGAELIGAEFIEADARAVLGYLRWLKTRATGDGKSSASERRR